MTGTVVTAGARCGNCQTPLVGPFCSNCGQRHEPHMHSMREFASETFENLTHADSRLWRTLWYLISRPGFLTVEFLEGRRARYLPPLRLYLVLSVVLFLILGSVNRSTMIVGVGITTDDSGSIKGLQLETNHSDETPAQRAQRICAGANFDISGLDEQRLQDACYKVVLDHGHEFVKNFYHNVPRALFVLLPILALAMKLLYWRRYYVEHLLFFIHTHAFTFVLFTLFALGMAVTSWGWLIAIFIAIVLFYPPVYTYRAMRRVYPQRKWITRLKFLALACVYLCFVLTLTIATSLYSLLTL